MRIDTPESLSTLKNPDSPLHGWLDHGINTGGIKRDRARGMNDDVGVDILDNLIESVYL